MIAAAIVLTVHAGPHIEELPLIGLGAFALAAGLGLWWAWLAVRSRKSESSEETPNEGSRASPGQRLIRDEPDESLIRKTPMQGPQHDSHDSNNRRGIPHTEWVLIGFSRSPGISFSPSIARTSSSSCRSGCCAACPLIHMFHGHGGHGGHGSGAG